MLDLMFVLIYSNMWSYFSFIFGRDVDFEVIAETVYCSKICELWTVILWYELNPRVLCAFGNVYSNIVIKYL